MVLRSIFTFIKLLMVTMVVILYIHYFIPQSWGFYTVEPKQSLFNIYTVHNKIVDKKSLIKNNLSYGMGVSRKGVSLYHQLQKIISNNNITWKLLNNDSLNYIIQQGKFATLAKATKGDAFEGFFLITKTSRPSYSDLKSGKRFQPLTQYVLADIR